ncbi:hypothetical protein D3C86_2084270 [compost metagenome]
MILDGRHGLYGVGTADGRRAGLRQAEVLDLALGDQVLDGSGHIFNRNGWVDAVLVEQVDAVGA